MHDLMLLLLLLLLLVLLLVRYVRMGMHGPWHEWVLGMGKRLGQPVMRRYGQLVGNCSTQGVSLAGQWIVVGRGMSVGHRQDRHLWWINRLGHRGRLLLSLVVYWKRKLVQRTHLASSGVLGRRRQQQKMMAVSRMHVRQVEILARRTRGSVLLVSSIGSVRRQRAGIVVGYQVAFMSIGRHGWRRWIIAIFEWARTEAANQAVLLWQGKQAVKDTSITKVGSTLTEMGKTADQ